MVRSVFSFRQHATPYDGLLRGLLVCGSIPGCARAADLLLRLAKLLEGAVAPLSMLSVFGCDSVSVFENGDKVNLIRVDFKQRWHNAVLVVIVSGNIIEITGPGPVCG